MLSGTPLGLLVFLGLVSLTGCWESPNVPSSANRPKTEPTQTDLIAFHKKRVAELDSLMTSNASDWPGHFKTGTGIHLEWLDRNTQAARAADLPKGTVLELHHQFSLLDGKVITSWHNGGPLAFELGATDLPSGFHEIIGSAFLGDSVRAFIPPSRAWGMTGLPPEIPQEAIIYVEMGIDIYRLPE